MTDLSPAEERAQREGFPVVRLIAHEAIRIAQGHPMVLELAHANGTYGQVLVQLHDADSLVGAVARAQATMPADIRPEPLTGLRALELTRALPEAY